MIDLLATERLIDSVVQLLMHIKGVSAGILGLTLTFWMLSIVYRHIKTGNENPVINFLILFVVMSLFISYDSWTIYIGKLIVEVSKSIYNPETSNPFQVFEDIYKHDNEWTFSIDIWTGSVDTNISFERIIIWLSCGLIFLSSTIFGSVQYLLQVLLWAFGPFAIAMSFIPLYKDAFSMWLKNFLAVNLWSVFYAFFLKLFSIFVPNVLSDNTAYFNQSTTANPKIIVGVLNGLEQALVLSGIAILCTVAIILIPMISSKIIPDGGIGAVASVFSGLSSLGSGVAAFKSMGSLGKRLGRPVASKGKDLIKKHGGKAMGNIAEATGLNLVKDSFQGKLNKQKTPNITSTPKQNGSEASGPIFTDPTSSKNYNTSNNFTKGHSNPIQSTVDYMNSKTKSEASKKDNSKKPTNNESIKQSFSKHKEKTLGSYMKNQSKTESVFTDSSTTNGASSISSEGQSMPAPRPAKKRPKGVKMNNNKKNKGKKNEK